jgi:hypothetical protein
MTDRQTDPYGYALEMAEKRRQWEQEREARREQVAREQKQLALEEYLTRRGKEHVDHTGAPPSPVDLERWQSEYLAAIEAEYQRARQEKIDRAIRENYR